MTDTFQIGDEVEWTSQAGGASKTKRGRVVAVVPANVNLWEVLVRLRKELGFTVQGGRGPCRNTESYAVLTANPRGDQYQKQVAWPRTKQLRKVTEEKESE